MKKLITASCLVLSTLAYNSFGQTNKVEQFMDKAAELQDNGDYKGAIAQYEEALKLDNKSPLINYKIASSYFALENYEKSVEYADKVINNHTESVEAAYILKGSALDVAGKPVEAINTYKKAIEAYPDNYLLHYNMGLTLYESQQGKEAEVALQKALRINPSHSSSHLLMGFVMSDLNNRVKSLLALYNFLLLEPDGKRAKVAYDLLDKQLKQGVTRDGENKTNILLSPDKDNNEFRPAEVMLSLLEASKNLEEKKNKTSYELFEETTNSFFSVVGGLKKEHQGFWWNFYVDFFYAMSEAKQVNAFCYYILQSQDDDNIKNWLEKNQEKVKSLAEWYDNYKRKL